MALCLACHCAPPGLVSLALSRIHERSPGVHSSLGGGQGFFLCSVGSGLLYVLMDSRL